MKINNDIAPLVGYVILTVIFTYPVAFSSEEVFPGDGGDGYWYAWHLWWVKKALLEFSQPPIKPPYIFYPLGVSIAPETQPFNAAIFIPVYVLLGLVTTYKVIWLLSFILSGYGAFLLVRHLTGDNKASFFSGIVFSFCPYHFPMP